MHLARAGSRVETAGFCAASQPHAVQSEISYQKRRNARCNVIMGHDERSAIATAQARNTISAVMAASLLMFGDVCPAAAKTRLTQEERMTIEIFKKATPSVVNVKNLAIRRDEFTMNMLEIPQGDGTGLIWDAEGHVVTNFHVINEARNIQVGLMGGMEYKAQVVGADQDKDIAVLKIVPTVDEKLRPLNLCSSSADLVVGQKVYAIGNPFGLDHTLTTGVVSGVGREIYGTSGRPIEDVIQTDAAINPGNSGGPLLDSDGCLIGINSAIVSPSGASNGVGFAVPVDAVRSSVGQIIKFGKVVHPVLGINMAPDPSAQELGVKGVMVLSSQKGGPAWKAGIRGTSRDEYGRLVFGDIIVAVNGSKAKNTSDVYKILDKSKVGDTLDLEVLRQSSREHVMVTLEANA